VLPLRALVHAAKSRESSTTTMSTSSRFSITSPSRTVSGSVGTLDMSPSWTAPTGPGALDKLRQALLPLAVRLRARLDIRDRPYRLRVFKNCFVGSECVDLLVRWGIAPSRLAAVTLGRQLLAARFIHHVVSGSPPA
jgi:hypothetical protein